MAAYISNSSEAYILAMHNVQNYDIHMPFKTIKQIDLNANDIRFPFTGQTVSPLTFLNGRALVQISIRTIGILESKTIPNDAM